MAQVVAAFGSSHSTMLVSSVEHWQEMFDRVDRRARSTILTAFPAPSMNC